MKHSPYIITKAEERHMEAILAKDVPTLEDVNFIEEILERALQSTREELRMTDTMLRNAEHDLEVKAEGMAYFKNLLAESAMWMKRFFLEKGKIKSKEKDVAEIAEVRKKLGKKAA